jgi:protocatechuate 3,4-dioxygenase beta subunit
MPLRKTVLACLIALLPLPLAAEPLRVSGVVRSVPGAPAAKGVRAELVPLLEASDSPLATADVRPDGSFELTAPEAGFYSVIVRAPGFMAVRQDLVPLLEETSLATTELPPTMAQVELRLTGPSGLPLAGVPVARQDDDFGGWIAVGGWGPLREAPVADDAGRVRFTDLRTPLRLRLLDPRFLGTVRTGGSGPVAVPRRRPHLLEALLPSGQPAAGAVVCWEGDRVASTGPDGRISLVLPEGEKLTVEAPGLWAEIPAVKPPEAGGPVPIRIHLAPLQTRTGRVTDAVSRRPLAGAWVWAEPFRPGTVPVRSDAEGRFSLPLPPGWTGRLSAAAAGYLPGTPTAAGAQPSVLELRPAAAISGRAVDPEGHPIAGAWIEAGIPGQSTSTPGRTALPRVQTAADGGFRLPGLLPDGLYELGGSHADFPRATLSVRTAPAGRATPPVRLVLNRGQIGVGRVVDGEGQPVAGAEVILLSDSEPQELLGATSGATGEIEIRRLRPGAFTLLASGKGCGALVRRGVQIPPRTPRVALGDIELPAPTVIAGRVTDTQGNPVAEAQVVAANPEPVYLPGKGPEAAWGTPGALTTGADGGFRFEGLRPGQRYFIFVAHPDYALARLPGVEAPAPEPLRITLTRGHALTGRVVGPDREPVAGATLTRVIQTQVTYDGGGGSSGSSERVGDTDAAGRFRIPGLAPGQIDLRIEAAGYPWRLLKGIQIPATGDPAPLEIVLERGAVLEGRVTDGRGTGVANAWISATPQRQSDTLFGSPGVLITTDEDGNFHSAELKPGPHSISVGSPGGRQLQAEKEIVPGLNRLDFKFPAAQEVSGWVRDDRGTPLPGAQVSLAPIPGGTVLDLATEVDGSFRLTSVVPGRYRVQASKEGFFESSPVPELEVGESDVQGLELRLTRSPMAIAGRLLGVTPEQQTRLRIGAQVQGHAGGWGEIQGRLDGRGGYRISELIPGEWTVHAFDLQGLEAYGRVRVEPGAVETTLDLDFSSGLTLSGRVISNGQPLSDAGIDLTSAARRNSTTTAYDGTFRIAGLQPGAVTVIVTLPTQGISQSRTLTLEGDRDLTIEIETGALSGRVLSEKTGTPMAGVTVELVAVASGGKVTVSGPSALTGPDGTFILPTLAAGTYRATLRGGSSKVEQTVTVPPGGSVSLEMVVPE